MNAAEQPIQLLGKFIHQKRTEKKFSFEHLGDLTGVSKSTIWKIEHGIIAQPRPEILIALGRALSIPAADLYRLANYPSPTALPSFGAYLRARYQDLNPIQIAQLEAYFAAITAQLDVSLDGPEPGEDEFDTV